jgi:lipopolysaccharide heptosyltransferase II
MITQIKKILVIRTDRIGEVLLSTPIPTALKEKWPSAAITMMIKPQLRELIEDNPYVSEIMEYEDNARKNKEKEGNIRRDKDRRGVIRETFRLSKIFKERKFDIVVVVNPKKEFHLAVFLAGIPIRVGFNRKWGFFLTHRVRDSKSLAEKHEIEYNLDLVRALGIEPGDKRPVLVVKDAAAGIRKDKDREGIIREDKGIVAIHPCTSNPKKQWPPEYFARLGDLLIAAGYEVAVIGGAENIGIAKEVVSRMKNKPQDLAGETGLKDLARFLKECRFLVSGDSGPVHIASAVGTKVMALFGSADPGSRPARWRPYGEGHVIIQKEKLEDIKPEEIIERIKKEI